MAFHRNGHVAEDDPMIKSVEIPEPSFKDELRETLEPLKALLIMREDPFHEYRNKSVGQRLWLALCYVFPIFDWAPKYKLKDLGGDVVAGLTITSLAVPQDLAYAQLARVPPVNGLYSSVLPPFVYAIMGTSRHIAIGPVAVVSLLIGTMAGDVFKQRGLDAEGADATLYLHFVFTLTFAAGIVQLAMGLFRLGWACDLLSHACMVGFMAGAAITIGSSQLRSLLGYTSRNEASDFPSVMKFIFSNTSQFNPYAFAIGGTFLFFLLALKVAAWYFKKNKTVAKVLFYVNCLGPLTAVVISTLAVFLSKCNQPPQNVPTIKKIPKGLSGMNSFNDILWNNGLTGTAFGVGAVIGVIALTEAIAIARTFAAINGYHIDDNKEMLSLGVTNIASSFTAGIVATGSFSRSSVNQNSGGKTMVTNILMSAVIILVLVAITEVFMYLPSSVLAAIIISAVLTLIDLPEAWRIWKADKIDFIVLLGTFFGVIFHSIEIGLLVGVILSMFKILVLVTRPHLAVLGEIPGTLVYRNVKQYRYAKTTEGVLAVRIDAPIYFTNANYLREKILIMVEEYEHANDSKLTHVVLDFTPVPDIDTTGIHALEELTRMLEVQGIQLGISNPSRMVLRKMSASGFMGHVGQENVFMSVNEASKTFSMMRATSDMKPVDGHVEV